MGAVSQEAKDRQARARKELYQMYKDHGLCPRCKDYADGWVFCKRCMKIIRARQAARDPTGEKRKAYCKERRRRLKEAGMCVCCGKSSAVIGQSLCPVCKAKYRESRIKYKIMKKIEMEAQKARGNAT